MAKYRKFVVSVEYEYNNHEPVDLDELERKLQESWDNIFGELTTPRVTLKGVNDVA